MVWSAPMTAVSGAIFTATQYNQFIRDNLLETGIAKLGFLTPGYAVMTGTNSISARYGTASSDFGGTTTSTSYVDVAGPLALSVQSGARAMVYWSCLVDNNTATTFSLSSIAVSGSTTIAASDSWCTQRDTVTAANPIQIFGHHQFTALTPGLNTFTMRHYVSAGTGSFTNRNLIIFPF